jgi:hypothetical protein
MHSSSILITNGLDGHVPRIDDSILSMTYAGRHSEPGSFFFDATFLSIICDHFFFPLLEFSYPDFID